MLLILGLMLGYITSSLVGVLNFYATSENVHSYTLWGLGSFSSVGWEQMPLFSILIIVGVGISLAMPKWLNMETEFMGLSKEKADEEAIRVFADNLRQLLLASPLGQKRILAIDPGYRTGCKVVCLDAQGNMLHNETIYPHPPQSESGIAMINANLPDSLPHVSFYIADCPYSDLKAQLSYRLKAEYHLPNIGFVDMASLWSRLLYGFWFGNVSPIAYIQNAKVPILFIHDILNSYYSH